MRRRAPPIRAVGSGLPAFAACCAVAWMTSFVPTPAHAAPSPCPEGTRIVPTGQDGRAIQQAIDQAPAGAVVMLGGHYQVDRTLRLKSGTQLCAQAAATLAWEDESRPGMLLDATRADRTRIQNLILRGRGIALKGRGHQIENNWVRGITGGPQQGKAHWNQRHGVLVIDRAEQLRVVGNRFEDIIDTGIMAYGLRDSTLSGNHFLRVREGIHLWSCGDTLIAENTGEGFTAMALEVQGDDLPGLRIRDNRFGNWRADHDEGYHAMSIVSGIGAVIQGNVVDARPTLGAALEVGGTGPEVRQNTFSGAPLVIATAPDARIEGNTLRGAGIVKDVNRVRGGQLTIRGNRIEQAPGAAITTDQWRGYDRIDISDNTIIRQQKAGDPPFIGILLTGTGKAPLQVTGNRITLLPADAQPAPMACLGNSGFEGDMRGTVVADNVCEGRGHGAFVHTNSHGGHRGVRYLRNTLRNLRQGITGDSSGLTAERNQLDRVASDPAGLTR